MKVIKIGATWCNGCHVMKPRWQEIESENPWLQTEFYDFDQSPDVMAQYKVDSNLPVAIFLDKDGTEITRYVGEVDKATLVKALNDHKDD